MSRLFMAALLFLAGASGAMAAYPSATIKLIRPFPTGSGVDVLARVIGDALSRQLGQPVVAINQPAASGNLALEQVAHAAPDGYTLFLPVNTIAAYIKSELVTWKTVVTNARLHIKE